MAESQDAISADATAPPGPAATVSSLTVPLGNGVDRHFRTDHLRADLKGRSVRGGTIMFAAQGIAFILNIASLMVLARLLTPADFGLIAMVAAVTGFASMFKDAGLSMATVQREQINHAQISTLFWINVGLSAILMAIIAAVSPFVAWFYGEPRLVDVTLAFAGIFLISGLTIQHQALLRRQMRFGVLAAIRVGSLTAGVGAAITAAVMGLGYWALVIQLAVVAAVDAACVWIACDWRPSRPVRGSGVRPMLAFGGNLTGFNFINYFARNADNILIGWYWGTGPLGFYSKAYQLLMLPIGQINAPMSAVALPVLSRLQNDPERFKHYYFKAIGLITFVGMPIVAFLFVEAHDVVLLVLGDQWLPAVPIFQALGVAAFLGTFNVAGSWVCTALGHTNRQLRWQAIGTPIALASFFLGLPWGVIGVAAAFSLSQLIIRPWGLWYYYRNTFLTLRDLTRVLSRPTCISILVALSLIPLSKLLRHWEMVTVLRLFLCSCVYIVVYIACWMTTNSLRCNFFEIIGLIRNPWPQKCRKTSISVRVSMIL